MKSCLLIMQTSPSLIVIHVRIATERNGFDHSNMYALVVFDLRS
jgi:hypothetical protein